MAAFLTLRSLYHRKIHIADQVHVHGNQCASQWIKLAPINGICLYFRISKSLCNSILVLDKKSGVGANRVRVLAIDISYIEQACVEIQFRQFAENIVGLNLLIYSLSTCPVCGIARPVSVDSDFQKWFLRPGCVAGCPTAAHNGNYACPAANCPARKRRHRG